jgi:hypothetical protein
MSSIRFYEACDTPTCIKLVGEKEEEVAHVKTQLDQVEDQLQKTYGDLVTCKANQRPVSIAPPLAAVKPAAEPAPSPADYHKMKSAHTSHFTLR